MTASLSLLGVAVGGALVLAGCATVRPMAQPEPPAGLTLYVATDGNDAWSGRLSAPNPARSDGPFATLERARDAIRQARGATGLPAGGVAVELAPGRYERSEPFALTAEDSGTADAPIVYRARAGAAVRLAGGRLVSDWRPVTDPAILDRLPHAARDHVVQADLRALGVTEYGDLAVDPGAWLQRRVADADCQGEFTMGSVAPARGAPRPERRCPVPARP